MTEQEWTEIDELLSQNHRIHAVKLLCGETGCGVTQVLEMLYIRYRTLRERHPEKFPLSEEEYWQGVYS